MPSKCARPKFSHSRLFLLWRCIHPCVVSYDSDVQPQLVTRTRCRTCIFFRCLRLGVFQQDVCHPSSSEGDLRSVVSGSSRSRTRRIQDPPPFQTNGFWSINRSFTQIPAGLQLTPPVGRTFQSPWFRQLLKSCNRTCVCIHLQNALVRAGVVLGCPHRKEY